MTTLMIIALCNFGEARSLGLSGQLWQATTIWNNAGGDINRLAEVAGNATLYSCWRGRYGNWLRALDPAALTGPDSIAWKRSIVIAEQMLAGKFVPVNSHVKFYRDDRITDSAFRRLFRRPLVQLVRVGNQTYYREEA